MSAKHTTSKANLSCLWAPMTAQRGVAAVSSSTLEAFRRELSMVPMTRGTRWDDVKATLRTLRQTR